MSSLSAVGHDRASVRMRDSLAPVSKITWCVLEKPLLDRAALVEKRVQSSEVIRISRPLVSRT